MPLDQAIQDTAYATLPLDESQFVQLAREAFLSANSYFDTAVRSRVVNNLRQFQSLHPSGSKYLSDAYRARSKFFRPKTRGMVRKNEATAAEAFFQQQDVVSVAAQDDDDPVQLASADFMKALLQYRLTKSVPWFQTVIGAYQDAMVQGIVCSYQYWEYDERRRIDRPCIKLKPLENIRFDPSADWTDPVNTSPYFIDMLPMYVKDVKQRMRDIDAKTGQPKWRPLTDSTIQKACTQYAEVVRLQREQGRVDPRLIKSGVSNYSVVWVHRNIVEVDGIDFVFHTLGTEEALDTPQPIDKVWFHGRRPYVIGNCVIETHRQYPGGPVELTSQIQGELNENANQRSDNVKFAMNKRYFVKRTGQVDVRSLQRNAPSSITFMNNPKDGEDVRVIDTPDVTRSSYEEQDRLNLDFDDLAGGFSQASVQSNRRLNETVGGMNLINQQAATIDGYQLRTFVETWAEPVLRQLVLLEQRYEDDDIVLALAGKQAGLIERFGINVISDHLLMQELHLTVNVGLGAVKPTEQLDRFLKAMASLKEILADGVLINYGADPHAIQKEIFGNLGYKDGARFFPTDGQDPRIAQLMKMVEQLQQALAAKHPPEVIAAQVRKLLAEARSIDNKTVKEGVEAMYSAVQTGEVIAAVPPVAPVADEILKAAGWRPPVGGIDPNLPQPGAPAPGLAINDVKDRRTGIQFTPGGAGAAAGDTSPQTPAQPASPGTGAARGIETPRRDGA